MSYQQQTRNLTAWRFIPVPTKIYNKKLIYRVCGSDYPADFHNASIAQGLGPDRPRLKIKVETLNRAGHVAVADTRNAIMQFHRFFIVPSVPICSVQVAASEDIGADFFSLFNITNPRSSWAC